VTMNTPITYDEWR